MGNVPLTAAKRLQRPKYLERELKLARQIKSTIGDWRKRFLAELPHLGLTLREGWVTIDGHHVLIGGDGTSSDQGSKSSLTDQRPTDDKWSSAKGLSNGQYESSRIGTVQSWFRQGAFSDRALAAQIATNELQGRSPGDGIPGMTDERIDEIKASVEGDLKGIGPGFGNTYNETWDSFKDTVQHQQWATGRAWDAKFPDGTTLYRGVRDDEAAALRAASPGDTVSMRPLTSFTNAPGIAARFTTSGQEYRDIRSGTASLPSDASVIAIRGANGSDVWASETGGGVPRSDVYESIVRGNRSEWSYSSKETKTVSIGGTKSKVTIYWLERMGYRESDRKRGNVQIISEWAPRRGGIEAPPSWMKPTRESLRETDDSTYPQINDAIEEAFIADELASDIEGATAAEYRMAYEEAAQIYDIGTSLNAVPVNTRAALKKYAEQFAQSVVDGEREALLGLIDHTIETGAGARGLKTAITSFFDDGIHRIDKSGNQLAVDNLDDWAHVVSVTELSRAYNGGARDLYEEAGFKQWSWVAAEDDSMCDPCGEADGQVVGIGETFPGVDAEQPPGHPMCRCTVIADESAIAELGDSDDARATAAHGNLALA